MNRPEILSERAIYGIFLQSFVLRNFSTALKSEAREPILALEFALSFSDAPHHGGSRSSDYQRNNLPIWCAVRVKLA